jgi:D-alanyl-D-alanine carboxypeptidase
MSTPRRGKADRAASVTKTFTAAAVLTLVDQSRVTLDAAVARHLAPPYLDLLHRGGYDPDLVTVRMLLNHTSGLYDYATDDGYVETALADLQRHWTSVEQIGRAMDNGSPNGAPSALFHYSDTGHVLLARIVESVTHGNSPKLPTRPAGVATWRHPPGARWRYSVVIRQQHVLLLGRRP